MSAGLKVDVHVWIGLSPKGFPVVTLGYAYTKQELEALYRYHYKTELKDDGYLPIRVRLTGGTHE